MKLHTSAIAFLLFALAAAGPTACGGEKADEAQQADVDRALDLALSDDSTAAKLGDVPDGTQAPAPRTQAPAPRTRAPAPRTRATPPPRAPSPPAPRYERYTVAAGIGLSVSLNQELSTRTNQIGDLFTATLLTPITDGSRVLIPAGATVRGEVTGVRKSGGKGQNAVLTVAFNEISFGGDTYPIQASITQANPTLKGRSSTGSKAAKIGGGAVAGGILGRVIGGNKTGTLIGAVVGAAAGTAITLGTEDKDAVLAAGSRMRIRLDAPIEVRRKI